MKPVAVFKSEPTICKVYGQPVTIYGEVTITPEGERLIRRAMRAEEKRIKREIRRDLRRKAK